MGVTGVVDEFASWIGMSLLRNFAAWLVAERERRSQFGIPSWPGLKVERCQELVMTMVSAHPQLVPSVT